MSYAPNGTNRSGRFIGLVIREIKYYTLNKVFRGLFFQVYAKL